LYDSFGMSNWVLNYGIVTSLVYVAILTTDLYHKIWDISLDLPKTKMIALYMN